MRNRRQFAPVVALALAASLAGCAAGPRTIAGFKEITHEIDAIVVMPPTFTLEKVGAWNKIQTVSEMNDDLEMELKKSLEDLVEHSRHDLSRLEAGDSVLAADAGLRADLMAYVEALDAVNQKLAESDKRTIDITFPASLRAMAARTGADYFLFVQGGGWVKTLGALATGIFFDAAVVSVFGGNSDDESEPEPSMSISLHAYLVGANRGKVLWYNFITRENADPRKPSELLTTAERLMIPLLGESDLRPDWNRDKIMKKKYKELEKRLKDREKAHEGTGGEVPPQGPNR